MTSNRTDAHSPANLVTEDYEYFGAIDHDWADESLGNAAAARNALVSQFLDMGYRFAAVHPTGQCDHCGARLRYAALMLHPSSRTVVEIGETCLDNRFERATDEFHLLRKSAKLGRERQALMVAITQFVVENPDLAFMADRDAEIENPFIDDVARKLRAYGSLTERQITAVRGALARDAEHVSREPEVTAQVLTGKVEIKGTVISTKWVYGYYGNTLKMLVKDDRGFKVWGTVPASLQSEDKINGRRVAFNATVEASYDDESFGYFKRPTKAQYITEEEV